MTFIDRKKALYTAVLQLMDEREDLEKIKMADIARKADIGKGTIYEYFPSKASLFLETMKYVVEEEAYTLRTSLSPEHGFKEGYYRLIKCLEKQMDTKMALFRNLIMSKSMFFSCATMETELRHLMRDFRVSCQDIFFTLIEAGIEEEILDKKPDLADLSMAIYNTLLCLFMAKEGFEGFQELTQDEIREKAYRAFVKLLQ